MAEALFQSLVESRGDYEVRSAGVSAGTGQAASRETREILRKRDIPLEEFSSRQIDSDLVDWATHIFTMTVGHLAALENLVPAALDKAFLVTEFSADDGLRDRDVSDPIGLGIKAYEETFQSLNAVLPAVLKFIEETSKKPTDQTMEKKPVEDVSLEKGSAGSKSSGKEVQKKLIIGGDHGGFSLKEFLVEHLKKVGFQIEDVGSHGDESVDYPDFAAAVSLGVLSGVYDAGILVCTSGIGMSIAANRFQGIQASLVTDTETAVLTRLHNDSNVLCLSAKDTAPDQASEIVDAWLRTEFSGGRHGRRVSMMNRPHTPAISIQDPEVASVIAAEYERQENNIELIASENFASAAVREAQGSHLTNKYAEGYPGRRWYGGCEEVDKVEQLAIDRAKKLFGATYANVQPHSGSQANTAVYFSLIDPGDRILTMDLSHGGHLTHGHPANFSGKFYEVEHYGVSKEDGRIDYDLLASQARKFQPKMITAGASAYPRTIDFERMGEIAKSVGAYLFVDMAHIAGLVAGGVHPTPIPHADVVTSTTHKSLRGPRGGIVLTNHEEIAKKIDSLVFPGVQGGPLMHVIAAKAVCFREALTPEFQGYQKQVVKNAAALANRLGEHGYLISSGGTDNHLMLVDLRPNQLNGKIAQHALDEAGITVNKNSIPFDTESPFKGGGIRIGTPAVTTRGMGESEMQLIGDLIHEALTHRKDASRLADIRSRVKKNEQESSSTLILLRG